MPRALSQGFRRELEEPRSTEQMVILLEIDHETLAEPIRVANDVVSYVFEDNTYLGFPFEFELLGDDNQSPRGQIRVQNVDRRIGQAVLELTTPPSLSIIILAGSDFTESLTDGKRMPIDTPVVEYRADHLLLGNVSVDVGEISAEIKSFELTNEPWPAIRATAERLPGLDP